MADGIQQHVMKQMEKYDISQTHAFLKDYDLPDLPSKYKPWLDVIAELPALLDSHKLREAVQQMEVIDTVDLSSKGLLRHAHLVISLITNSYVWQEGESGLPKSIPRQLSLPLHTVSDKLDIRPIICHTDLVLTNFTKVDKSKPLKLGNMQLIYRFTVDPSCDWFFLTTVQVELECLPAVKAILYCQACMSDKLDTEIVRHLSDLSAAIESIRITFLRMHEQLDAGKFYNLVRPFLNGWHEDGIVYEGINNDQPIKAHGGSAAQCTTIQAIDLFLGVKHSEDKRNFLRGMRDYMPAKHRNFLTFMDEAPNMQHYAMTSGSSEVQSQYEDCVKAMVSLRSTHIQIVVKYITIQASKVKSHDYQSLEKQGTGGQTLLPFLKDIRSTTQHAAGALVSPK